MKINDVLLTDVRCFATFMKALLGPGPGDDTGDLSHPVFSSQGEKKISTTSWRRLLN